MRITPVKMVFGSFVLLIFALAVWAFYLEPSSLVVNRYPLALQKWSNPSHQLKIAAIADLHAGSNFIDEAKIRKVVELTNEQEPDVIVLLGDYLSPYIFERASVKMPPEEVFRNLAGLKAKYGVFAVIGNHDNDFGRKRVRAGIEAAGYTVLEDELRTIEKDGKRTTFLGTKDALTAGNAWRKISDGLKSLLKNSGEIGDLIVLTHNPDAFAYLTGDLSISDNFSLLVAGHTHGGQCRFPVIGAPIVPSEYGQKYAAGHVHDHGIDIFVSTGIGTSMLPVRFGVTPEITVLELSGK